LYITNFGRTFIRKFDMTNFINIPFFEDHKGLLQFISTDDDWMPFHFKRIYFIKDVPKGEVRGAHGHMRLEQVFIPISGVFHIKVENIFSSNEFVLSDSKFGLHVGKNSWREVYNFTQDSICLVLASEPYDEHDYFYDKEDFFKKVNGLDI